MSLKAIYERFLDSPNPLSLSENAAYNYITTLTTVNGAGQIVKHLETQNKSVVKKKSHKVIGAVEGQSAVCLDVEYTLEFIADGGAYLPRLDGNFLTDKIVSFPTIHTVHFDQDNKISNIRVCWDQGSLLKLVDVIGKNGRNWPIFDGKDQARLIASVPTSTVRAAAPSRGRNTTENDPLSPPAHASPVRSMSPSKKHIKDPHASLNLFEPQKQDERSVLPAPVAPRASAKPPPRDQSELFAAGHEDYDMDPSRPGSPKKDFSVPVMAPKGGGAQKFQAPRIFEEETEAASPVLYKSNPAKYNHFELGDAPDSDHFQPAKSSVSENVPIPLRAKTNRHLSTWAFEDFVTPEKVKQKVRSQDERHFGWSDDEEENAKTPKEGPKVVHARPDAEPHFEFKDDGTPDAKRANGPARGAHAKGALGLYQNHLYEDGLNIVKSDREEPSEPLKPITNNTGRKNDFDSHWSMEESSPGTNGKVNNENKPLGENRKKAVNMMEAQWDSVDQSPEGMRKPGNAKLLRGGLESHWGGYDENAKTSSGKKEERSFWDF